MKTSKFRSRAGAFFSLIACGVSFSILTATTFAAPATDTASPASQAAAINPTDTKKAAVIKSNTKSVNLKAKEKALSGPSENPRATGVNTPKPPTPPKDELIASSKLRTPTTKTVGGKQVLPTDSLGNRATGVNTPKPPTPPKDELKPIVK
jgi:hypothetical protein